MARHLQRWGALVTAYLVLPRPEQDPKLDQARERGVSFLSASEDPALGALDGVLVRSRLVMDAVLGTGRMRPLDGAVREVMLRLSAARKDSMDISERDVTLALEMQVDLEKKMMKSIDFLGTNKYVHEMRLIENLFKIHKTMHPGKIFQELKGQVDPGSTQIVLDMLEQMDVIENVGTLKNAFVYRYRG